MTFKDFLNRIRISHAERLLLETNLPMSDVASLCGYESGNYFGDVFKKTKVFPLSNSGKQKVILHKKGLTLKMR